MYDNVHDKDEERSAKKRERSSKSNQMNFVALNEITKLKYELENKLKIKYGVSALPVKMISNCIEIIATSN